MKTFDYIQDPGHGWIKVPVALLLELNIADNISVYSYYRDGFAYLEEDCDAARFMIAYRARFGTDPKLRDRVARERRSKVREYLCYTPAIAANIAQGAA
jgi:hypothetical protein